MRDPITWYMMEQQRRRQHWLEWLDAILGAAIWVGAILFALAIVEALR